jgi:hypothetical protein
MPHRAPANTWCLVQSMVCGKCARRFDANEGHVLVSVPAYAANAYPVDTKYAFGKSLCHLSRVTTEVFSTKMITYGNGELCSKLLFNAVNRSYLEAAESYLSYVKAHNLASKAEPFLTKDGEYI